MHIPAVTRKQMTLVDEYTVESGIEIMQLMENAARNIATFARQQLGALEGKRILILCGKGNNGGDGLAAARFLRNWGASPVCVLAENGLNDLSKHQKIALKKTDVKVLSKASEKDFNVDLIIDTLIGYNLLGDPRGNYAKLIKMANASDKRILAVDIPTGLDADTGMLYNPCIQAKWTLTLAIPKTGLLERVAKKYVGDLWLCDIGIPRVVYERLQIDVPNVFREKEIVKV